jgi:hypothetical protein
MPLQGGTGPGADTSQFLFNCSERTFHHWVGSRSGPSAYLPFDDQPELVQSTGDLHETLSWCRGCCGFGRHGGDCDGCHGRWTSWWIRERRFDASLASVRPPRNDALWAGVRFPCSRSAERNQDAGLYVRAGRRDSRRILRPTDERVLQRVPGRQVTAAASVVGRPGSVQPAAGRRRHDDGRAIGAMAN